MSTRTGRRQQRRHHVNLSALGLPPAMLAPLAPGQPADVMRLAAMVQTLAAALEDPDPMARRALAEVYARSEFVWIPAEGRDEDGLPTQEFLEREFAALVHTARILTAVINQLVRLHTEGAA